MKTSKKAQLIATARAMFNAQGFHATGIDALLARAGVSKMTLYKYFPSKDALIAEALNAEERDITGRIVRAAQSAPNAAEGLLSIFDIYAEMAASQEFRGCLFSAAATEFKDPLHPVHRQCDDFKRALMRHLAEWAEKAALHNPAQYALFCLLLLEGALALAHSCSDASVIVSAKQAARASPYG